MRVAVITNIVAPYRTPVFAELARRCELLVVYEALSEANRRWGVDGELPFPHVVLRSWTLDLGRLKPGAYAHVPRRPLAALARFAPDCVVAGGGGVWSSPANLAALVARARRGWAYVPWWESFARPRPTLPRRLAEPWVRGFVRSADAWLGFGSRATADLLRLGADPGRTVQAPQPASPPVTEAIPPASARPEDEPRGDSRMLYVGRLAPGKGLEVLVRAWSQVSGGELWIAGEGPLRPQLEAVARADGRIRLLGHLEQPELERCYRSAGALVFPSLHDVWGMVVNEALAHGLPVVTTDQVGAADDLVQPGVTGAIVPAGDPDALAAAIADVAAWDRERRVRAADRARELLAAHTPERAAAAIAEACELAVAHRAGRLRAV